MIARMVGTVQILISPQKRPGEIVLVVPYEGPVLTRIEFGQPVVESEDPTTPTFKLGPGIYNLAFAHYNQRVMVWQPTANLPWRFAFGTGIIVDCPDYRPVDERLPTQWDHLGVDP